MLSFEQFTKLALNKPVPTHVSFENNVVILKSNRIEKKSYKIERMGILPKFHSQGFGRMALEEIKILSRNSNMSKIILDSIFDVRGFYAKSGFVQDGDIYLKVGIPHVKMYFTL